MNINAGTIVISSPSLDDPNFEQTVILITEHNEKGAMGFIINQLFPRVLNELAEFKNGIAFPLYDGGPMDKEHIYFLHQRPDLIEGSTPLSDSIFLGGDFKQAVAHINEKILVEKDMKILIGYCGWDYLQLEEEVKEGSWLIVNTYITAIFPADAETLWQKLYHEKR